MNKKLVYKMIRNCFKQYYSELDSWPIDEEELEALYKKILQFKVEEPHANLHEVINDMVYEFLTN
ncbi:MAG: YqzH family protein [Bacillota bacterium]|nr:YqzH family protein [Bacillota bacterium]